MKKSAFNYPLCFIFFYLLYLLTVGTIVSPIQFLTEIKINPIIFLMVITYLSISHTFKLRSPKDFSKKQLLAFLLNCSTWIFITTFGFASLSLITLSINSLLYSAIAQLFIIYFTLIIKSRSNN